MSRIRLRSSDLNPDPFAQFNAWYAQARKKSGLINPDAFALSTASASQGGWPEVRMVLLKEASPKGFVFYTNFESDKGRAILADPRVELDFYWELAPLPSWVMLPLMRILQRPSRLNSFLTRLGAFLLGPLGRQIRVQGRAERVSDEEADRYFASRARLSQLGAWASQQSREATSREAMDQALADLEKKYQGRPVPRPAHWSGFRVVPERFEFWQADPFRFHDRFRYAKEGSAWKITRLYP